MIRVRLAVFLTAAAIVFAPGGGFEDGSAQRQLSGVAAGMLAPTFDEHQVAGYPSTAFAKKAQGQERRHFIGLLALAAFVGACSFASSRAAGLLDDRTQLRLQLFVSSLRDRGPPHLQLV